MQKERRVNVRCSQKLEMQKIEVNVRSFEKTRNAEERRVSVRCSQKLEMQEQKKNQC